MNSKAVAVDTKLIDQIFINMAEFENIELVAN